MQIVECTLCKHCKLCKHANTVNLDKGVDKGGLGRLKPPQFLRFILSNSIAVHGRISKYLHLRTQQQPSPPHSLKLVYAPAITQATVHNIDAPQQHSPQLQNSLHPLQVSSEMLQFN